MVFGGVYSNLQALEELIQIAKQKNIPPSNIFCTGDIVGYCAQPTECIDLVQKWGIQSILGNVEIQLINNEDDCGCDFNQGSHCDLLSNIWYPYAKNSIKKKHLDFLRTIPLHLSFDWEGKKVGLVHGSSKNVSEFIFESDNWNQKEPSFSDLNCDMVVAGHCGLPFQTSHESKCWFNPGVIGMPANDGTARVWYGILENGKAYHHSFTYEHAKAAALMHLHKLPKAYAQTLLTGIWDNCDILPPKETSLQGIRI